MNLILENQKESNLDKIYQTFMSEFLKDELLLKHRIHIEKNNLGYGERPFHTMWRELVKLQPKEFKFLEIGVYKGQVLSLIKLLSDNYDKKVEFYGAAPFDSSGDKFSTYQKTNYENIIKDLFNHFNLSFNSNINLIKGDSTKTEIKTRLINMKSFDIVYIDGCHDYNCVISDIELTKQIVKVNGFVVLDDSSCFKSLSNEPGRFKGHIDVCNAVKEKLELDTDFVELICVGHNRVFKKIK